MKGHSSPVCVSKRGTRRAQRDRSSDRGGMYPCWTRGTSRERHRSRHRMPLPRCRTRVPLFDAEQGAFAIQKTLESSIPPMNHTKYTSSTATCATTRNVGLVPGGGHADLLQWTGFCASDGCRVDRARTRVVIAELKASTMKTGPESILHKRSTTWRRSGTIESTTSRASYFTSRRLEINSPLMPKENRGGSVVAA